MLGKEDNESEICDENGEKKSNQDDMVTTSSSSSEFELHSSFENQEIAILLENFNDEMIYQFISTLKNNLTVWPCPNRFDFLHDNLLNDYNEYKKETKEFITHSKVIIAFVTNKFCHNRECIEWIEYSRGLEKPLFALIVEEIKNYEKIKEEILHGFQYYCEIYRARVNTTIYDHTLWISSFYEDLNFKLADFFTYEHSLLYDLEYKKDLITHYYNIDSRANLDIIENLTAKFDSITNNGVHRNLIKQFKNYNDISKIRINKILGRKYLPSLEYDYYDAVLESYNISCKNGYLHLVQYFFSLVDTKFIELIIKSENEKYEYFENSNVERNVHILNLIKYRTRNKQGIDSYSDPFYIVRKMMAEEIYDYIKDKFHNLNIDFNLVAICNLPLNQKYNYNSVKQTSVVFIYLFESFYKSKKFKIAFKNFLSIKKKVYILQLEEFYIDYSIFLGEEFFGGIYFLYKHKDDSFNGYELRRLLSELEDDSDNFSTRCRLEIQQKYDIFICDSVEKKENTPLDQLKESFKEKNIIFFLKSDITDTHEEAVYDKIELSKMVLIFLTNSYVRSGSFKKDYGFCEKNKSFVVYILLEPIHTFDLNLNKFNVFDFYNNKLDKQVEVNDQLWYLLSTALNRKNVYKTKKEAKIEINDQPYFKEIVDFENNNFENTSNPLLDIVGIPENNHLLIILKGGNNSSFTIDNKKLAYIFDRDTMVYLKKIEIDYIFYNSVTEDNIESICFVKCLNRLCFIINNKVCSMNLDYADMNLINKFDTNINLMCYNEASETIYLYNTEDNTIETFKGHRLEFKNTFKLKNVTKEIKSMKIIKNLLYILTNNHIHVFDLNLNFINTFGSSQCSNSINFFQILSSDYIYVVDKNELKIFSIFNFKYIDSVVFTEYNDYPAKRLKIKFFDNLIINLSLKSNFNPDIAVKYLFIKTLKTQFTIPQHIKADYDNTNFLCKINDFKRHLLFNPYRLPCGNISCLECIIDNYIIVNNEFKCPFKGCKSIHLLKNEIVKSHIIEENTFEICRNQIRYFDKRFKDLSTDYNDQLETFRIRFDELENDIDLRFECIVQFLDAEYEKSTAELTKLQKVLIDKNQNQTMNLDKIELKELSLIQQIHIGKTDLITIRVKTDIQC